MGDFFEIRDSCEDACKRVQVLYIPQELKDCVERIEHRQMVEEIQGYERSYLQLINDTYAKYRFFFISLFYAKTVL
jgi:hypothetical protein